MKPLQPLDLTVLDRPLPPPEFVLDDALEPGAVTMVAGDTGSAKSMVALSMSLAVSRGEPWLDRATQRGPVIVSDAEMVKRLAYERLGGFGVRGSDRGSMVYLSRQPIDLGNPADVEAMRKLCAKAKAKVLTLDALMGHAPGVDVNDNAAAVRIYTEVLRPLAGDLDLALLLVHHDRKHGQGAYDSSQATMGARQWVGQADYQFTLERASKRNASKRIDPDGGRHTIYRVRLRRPKHRGDPDQRQYEPLRVVSRHHPDGRLDWIRVEVDDDAPADDAEAGADHRQELAERITEFVQATGASRTAEIAAAVGIDPTNGSFKRALGAAGLERVSKGVYRCG